MRTTKAKSTSSNPKPIVTSSITPRDVAIVHTAKVAAIDQLRPHQRNYKTHPDDQIQHIVESIKVYGFYRNVVVAEDYTILAGHASVQAAKLAGLSEIPIVQLNIKADDPLAVKLIIGDNEIGHLSEIDDRALTELLREIKDSPSGLIGTGFDESMLAALVFNTRTGNELNNFDNAAEWAGMPAYESQLVHKLQLVVVFETEADREQFIAKSGLAIHAKSNSNTRVVARWPVRERDDISAFSFEAVGVE